MRKYDYLRTLFMYCKSFPQTACKGQFWDIEKTNTHNMIIDQNNLKSSLNVMLCIFIGYKTPVLVNS